MLYLLIHTEYSNISFSKTITIPRFTERERDEKRVNSTLDKASRLLEQRQPVNQSIQSTL